MNIDRKKLEQIKTMLDKKRNEQFHKGFLLKLIDKVDKNIVKTVK